MTQTHADISPLPQVTECEIFLSLVVRLLEPDKPVWQRAVALEVIHRLSVQEDIITSFCTSYDMKPHSTKIVQVAFDVIREPRAIC